MPKRLLFVDNNPDFFLSHRLPIGRAARDMGYEIHVAAPSKPSVAAIEKEGFTFHSITMSRRGMNVSREFATLAMLYRLYLRLRPDIVHHLTIKPILYGGIAARLAGVPAVVSAVTGLGYVFLSRGTKASVVRALVKGAYRHALGHPRSAVIFQNPDDRDDFLSWRLVDAEKAELIRGAGVDMSLFSPSPEPAGPPVVLLPSRLLWDKGVGEFVEAARMLRARGVTARFALAGNVDEGNPAVVPRSLIEAWVEEGVVEWHGRRDDMPVAFSESHVVCLPSYREGLPKVLVEAAACARAIVTTDVPGCREAVDDGVNGLLVPVRDATALALALEKILADRETRLAMGRAGRRKVETTLSVDAVVSATLALYRKLSP